MLEEELMKLTQSAEIKRSGIDGARQYYTCISLKESVTTLADVKYHCKKGEYKYIPDPKYTVNTEDTYTCRYMPEFMQHIHLQHKYPNKYFYKD